MQLTIDTSLVDALSEQHEQSRPQSHDVRASGPASSQWSVHAILQAIANTAAFHIPTVERGGGSLRLAMAQKATSVEVLRLLISMGPIELMHFQTWSNTAANAPRLTDPDQWSDLPGPQLGSGSQ